MKKVYYFIGARAMRQFLCQIHCLSERKDASRSDDGRSRGRGRWWTETEHDFTRFVTRAPKPPYRPGMQLLTYSPSCRLTEVNLSTAMAAVLQKCSLAFSNIFRSLIPLASFVFSSSKVPIPDWYSLDFGWTWSAPNPAVFLSNLYNNLYQDCKTG